MSCLDQICAPTNWWSAAALGGLMTGGGGAPRIFLSAAAAWLYCRRRRHQLRQRAVKQRTGAFFLVYRGQPLHL